MSHYSLAQKPAELSKWAKAIAQDICNRQINYPVLVYSGMSGISSATAISLNLYSLGKDHGMVYVRKENEKSHGDPIETEFHGNNRENQMWIFVDDFISSGKTCNYVYDKVNYHLGINKFDYFALQGDGYAGSNGTITKLENPEDLTDNFLFKFNWLKDNKPNWNSKQAEFIAEWKKSIDWGLTVSSETINRGNKLEFSGIWIDEFSNFNSEQYKWIEKSIDKRVKKDQYKPVKQKQNIPFWANNWRK